MVTNNNNKAIQIMHEHDEKIRSNLIKDIITHIVNHYRLYIFLVEMEIVNKKHRCFLKQTFSCNISNIDPIKLAHIYDGQNILTIRCLQWISLSILHRRQLTAVVAGSNKLLNHEPNAMNGKTMGPIYDLTQLPRVIFSSV